LHSEFHHVEEDIISLHRSQMSFVDLAAKFLSKS